MAGGPTTIVVGNATADPELRYTQNGIAVANLTLAQTPRVKNGDEWEDGEPIFIRVSVWRDVAENVAASITKGTRVIAIGELKMRSYETKEGEKRQSLEMEIEHIAVDLRFATAQVTRKTTSGGQRNAQARQQVQQRQAPEEPWNTPGQTYSDDTPF